MTVGSVDHQGGPRSALWSWYFMRITGVVMLALVLGHLAIVHYLNAPSATDSAFVAARWSQTFWLGFDWTLLLIALLHGLAGVRAVATDYLHTPSARRTVTVALSLLALVFICLGTGAILSFNPDVAAGGRGPLTSQRWLVSALDAMLDVLAIVAYAAIIYLCVYFATKRLRGQPVGPWSFAGQWAWALHRVTGLGIVGFLLVHVLDILLLPLAPDLYNLTIASYANPFLIPMEAILVAAVLYHALNGVRLMAIEFGSRSLKRRHAQLFFAVLTSAAILLLPSVAVLLRAAR